MELITPTSPTKNYSDKKIVFLAGPIKGAPDWQAQAVSDLSDLDIYVANPRRENVMNFNLDLQVDWESKFLAAADVIMFWIPPKETDVSGRDYAQLRALNWRNGWRKPIITIRTSKWWSGLMMPFSAKVI